MLSGKRRIVLWIAVAFSIGLLPHKSFAGAGDAVMDGLKRLYNAAEAITGKNKDVISKDIKRDVAEYYWKTDKIKINYGKPLDPYKVQNQGVIYPYECSVDGAPWVMFFATVKINDELLFEDAKPVDQEKYEEFLSNDNAKKFDFIIVEFPEVYKPE